MSIASKLERSTMASSPPYMLARTIAAVAAWSIPFGPSVEPGQKLQHFLAHMMRWWSSRTLCHGLVIHRH
ncbi:hypothetical protein HZ326_22632 [Fusarium oxysporum f. sp. albedinis]|nr:hypothetical protein HZ326_22632 [Fusarium oxysporum f. sp. albedinis]